MLRNLTWIAKSSLDRGGVRTGATGAIAPVDFDNFYKIEPKKEIFKIRQDLTKVVANV